MNGNTAIILRSLHLRLSDKHAIINQLRDSSQIERLLFLFLIFKPTIPVGERGFIIKNNYLRNKNKGYRHS